MITKEHLLAMDSAKFEVFVHPTEGAFLGSLMCSMEVSWDTKIPTACTDGMKILFNPDWFMSLPEMTRPTILMHELRHVGYLHLLRAQGKEHKKFNYAADYVINLQLKDEGYSFEDADPLLDEQYRGMAVEEVYDMLPENFDQKQLGCFSNDPGDGDLAPSDPTDDQASQQLEEMIATVYAAALAQQHTGCSSNEVDAIVDIIKKRNQPKVNWKEELKDFAQERARAGLDYTKRNRRYQHVILSARGKRGRLIELDFFFDVSGSVTEDMIAQMITEIAYIHGVLKPKALNLIQFDKSIRRVQTFREHTPINEIEIHGRGGTSLTKVADRLEANRPAGAVIMTDLDCLPMRVVKNVPILWLCINNPSAVVNQGKLIHIEV